MTGSFRALLAFGSHPATEPVQCVNLDHSDLLTSANRDFVSIVAGTFDPPLIRPVGHLVPRCGGEGKFAGTARDPPVAHSTGRGCVGGAGPESHFTLFDSLYF